MACSSMATNEYMNLLVHLTEPLWQDALRDEVEKSYFTDLLIKLATASMAGKVIYPPVHLTFNAFNKTPLDKVKVVILGQDPYPSPGMAMGLAFSVQNECKKTLSLRSIFKELSNIEGFVTPEHGNLEYWAEQGVLLLNSTLTVEAGKPNSHSQFGWQTFTNHVIQLISDRCCGVVFMLWGEFAHQKAGLIDQSKHSIIRTCHPASRNASPNLPFFGFNCFSLCNVILAAKYNRTPINWSLPQYILQQTPNGPVWQVVYNNPFCY